MADMKKVSKNNAKPKPRQKSKSPTAAAEVSLAQEILVEFKATKSIKPDSDMISIDLKKHTSKKCIQRNDISSVAKKLKDRLSKAAKQLSDPAMSLPPTPPPSYGDKSELDMPQEAATTANTMLSESDWSNNKPISLRNLQLLKQYLIFVSKESTEISFKERSIQLSLSNRDESTEPSTESERSARCGATLIESYVHEASNMDKELHLSRPEESRSHSRLTSRLDRKRPGRPPKSQSTNEVSVDEKAESSQRIRMKRKSIQRHPSTSHATNTSIHSTHHHLKKKNIQCICSSPHDEIQSMVQCDDCFRYLHLDCLELNDAALTETFRCPSCFLSLGSCTGKNAKLLSAITWRYAAQWKSQRLALKSQDAANTDDEDAEEYDDDDFSTAMEIDSSPLSRFNFTAATVGNSSNSTAATPPPLHLHDDDDGYSTDLPGPETPTDWPDVSSESRFSSQDSSASEVTTPNENLFLDPFDTKEDGQLVLDPESLEILSRLAYLQSLDSVKKELFAPNASDVFLCENLSNNSTVPVASQAPRFAANAPPSDICSQDLSEFSFDSGPFWEPLF
ncbi:hypothetical protein [Parasitella parasitica]|uniref:Zinc finger PHD-type domain-containing protein n=1 Tax=Parasitella parasitica TaxID=35722 RepID=A0A0B7N5F1_9FUNG|nr:hypothetical protein [Parasitella parasitica]